MAQSSPDIRKQTGNVDGNQKNRRQNNNKVNTHLRRCSCRFQTLLQNQIIHIEVHAEQNHENRNNPLQIRGIAGNTVVSDTEASRSGCSEHRRDRIKERHPAKQQKDKLQQTQSDIHAIEQHRRAFYTRYELADRRPRALCFHHVHVRAACKRKYRHHKYQHTHASDPVRKTTPEQQAVRHMLDLRQNTRAGRRKSGDDFKQCINVRRNLTGNHKWKRAKRT